MTGYYTIFGATGIEAAKNSLLSGNDSSLDGQEPHRPDHREDDQGRDRPGHGQLQAQDAAWNALKALGQAGRAWWRSTRRPARSWPWPPTRASTPTVLAIHDGAKLNKVDNQLLNGPGAAAAEPGHAGDVPARFDVQDRDELGRC